MVLPSRKQTFAFADCRELLEKLDREIDRYQEVAGRKEREPAALVKLVDQLKDSAFNASVTAWHLCDWVFNDMTPDKRQELGFKDLHDLQDYVRKHCRALHLCRQAATASKHWTVNQHHDPNVHVLVTCYNNVGWIIYFVHNGEKLGADQVFREALTFWTEFTFQHEIRKAHDGA
jgi:hypothetical protein